MPSCTTLRALDAINRVLIDALHSTDGDLFTVRLAYNLEDAWKARDVELVTELCEVIEGFELEAPAPRFSQLPTVKP